MDNCPCCSGRRFETCCGPFLANRSNPQTAEALMRSRYTAYALDDATYLARTGTRGLAGEFDEAAFRAHNSRIHWQRLTVRHTSGGGPHDAVGTVTFVAYYMMDGVPHTLSETSGFIKRDGRWIYRDAPTAKARSVPTDEKRVGRNAPCPCGSGRKYKQCCLK